MSRNAGSVLLLRLAKTQDNVARMAGVSGVTVHNWQKGKKKPAAPMREKLFDLFKIPPSSWDDAPTKVPTPTSGASQSPRRDDDATFVGGPFAMARELEDHARSLLQELRAGLSEDGVAVSPLERAKVMASVATTLDKLTKITGQHDLGRRVLKLPMFVRAKEEIVKALQPFPGAAKAVAERLDDLERESLKAS